MTTITFGPLTLPITDAEAVLRRCESAVYSGQDSKTDRSGELYARVQHWLTQNGLPEATMATGWAFWKAVSTFCEDAKRRHREAAQLAFWFKVDPYTLTREQRFGLLQNLDTVQAQDRLHRGDYDPADYATVYALYKLAHDDEELARQKQADALELYVERQTRRR